MKDSTLSPCTFRLQSQSHRAAKILRLLSDGSSIGVKGSRIRPVWRAVSLVTTKPREDPCASWRECGLFVTQGGHRIHLGGAARGNIASRKSNEGEERG